MNFVCINTFDVSLSTILNINHVNIRSNQSKKKIDLIPVDFLQDFLSLCQFIVSIFSIGERVELDFHSFNDRYDHF